MEQHGTEYWRSNGRKSLPFKISVGPYCVMIDDDITDCEEYCYDDEMEECHERMEYIRRMQEGLI